MLNVINNSKDIYFNLALEEYLLRKRTEDIIMIWQSETSIVAGKHQNILAEINHSFIRENKIPLARRLSGGGTVFHGPGNINFTFIKRGEPGKLMNFNYFISPIVEFLGNIGISAEIGKRNELLIADKKISGNAEHIFKDRVLHHGTLLFNANLTWLDESIKTSGGKYFSKAVQSNRSEVTNISDYVPLKISADEFALKLSNFLSERMGCAAQYHISKEEMREVEFLRDNKYSTNEWIFGYSPAFELLCEFDYAEKRQTIKMNIEKGLIREISFNDKLPDDIKKSLIRNLPGKMFSFEMLNEVLNQQELDKDFKKLLISSIF